MTYTVAGFACSRIADRISKMSKEEVTSAMLQQLDSMFAKRSAYQLLANSATDASEDGIDWNVPASSCFLECLIHDWGKVPFVKGGYSSPTVGATRQIREDLNRPIGDKVFFAGEATNPDSFMTLHGKKKSENSK
jgi:monoamine oxidase